MFFLQSKKIPIILIGIPTIMWASYLSFSFPQYVQWETITSDRVTDSNVTSQPLSVTPAVLPVNVVKEEVSIDSGREIYDVSDTIAVNKDYTIRKSLMTDWRKKNLPLVSGDTVRDRAISFLSSVWLQDTIGTWEEYAISYKIYYTLPLCIAYADSHLWKALKSTNNIGNVGNNDRGDTVHYATLDDWIEAMFRSLANGKYLRWHQQIATLSNEWRTRMWLPNCNNTAINQKCYATSEQVWSTNVVNCMSTIHNSNVDENFYFRLNI